MPQYAPKTFTKMPFLKMHGLGNDFVILDHRASEIKLSPEQVKRLSHRRFGIGCDQLIVLEKPKTAPADAFMRIYNPNGREAGACGNATRCVGSLLAEEFKRPNCIIETVSGLLKTTRRDDGQIQVDMGAPKMDWQDIPLSKECDTLHLPIQKGVLSDPVAVNVGNPHMVFFVKDVSGIDIHTQGKFLTKHDLYPENANIQFVEVIDRNTLRVRVYERGAGITLASGTGGSASVVAACKRGLIDGGAKVIMDGGELDISYDKTVLMTGPVGHAFQGTFDENIFGTPA